MSAAVGSSRRLLPALALAASLTAASCLWTAAPPRNVLLVTIDTLRADRVGAFGSQRGLTPTLDALAKDGVRFANAYSVVPLTAPSHASMLTGRHPVVNGLRNNGTQVLPDAEVLVSELLKARGFATAAIVSALVLSSDFGLNQGWDLYYEEDILGSRRGHGLWYDQRPADKTVDRALAWLRAEKDRPFLLWVHLFDPHGPYDPPSPYKEAHADVPYDGEVAFADAQIGRLLDALREMGQYERTLVIAAADHGEGLGDHEETYHGIFLYDSTMRVPLIVRPPGGGGGRVVEDLASTLDVAPTILDALGIPLPEEAGPVQGVSLVPALGGGRVPARSVYLESIYGSTSYGWAVPRALVRGRNKWIELPGPELYDLKEDPAETRNLSAERSGEAEDLGRRLAQARAEMEGSARVAETAAIDDETRDRLISLGYIGGQQSGARSESGPDPKEMAYLLLPLNIASMQMKDRKYADAELIYKKIREVDPDNRIVLMQLARALSAQDKLDEAADLYEHALRVYPDVEEYYRRLAWEMLRAGRRERAREVLTRAASAMPESAHLHLMLGHTLLLEDRCDRALPELDLAVRLNPKGSRPHYMMAICRLKQGDEPAALASLREYLKRDPDVNALFTDPRFADLRRLPAFQDLVKKHL